MKHTLLAAVGFALVVAACSWTQKKIGDRAANVIGNGAALYFECAEPVKVVKWFQDKCASFGACSEPTGPLSGAILKPIIDKFVPEGVDFIIPDAWGYCKATKPKEGLKSFLYGIVDRLQVKLEE